MIPTANGFHGAGPLGTPTRAIVLGYYDGPTAGVAQFGDGGPVYRFEMPDEDGQLAAGRDDREYLLHPLPVDALDRLEAAIARHLPPDRPVWFPLWKFPTPEAQQEADAAVDAILAEAGPPTLSVTAASGWIDAGLRPVRVVARQPA